MIYAQIPQQFSKQYSEMGSQNSLQLIQNPLPKDYRCSYEYPNIFVSIVDHTKLQKHTISIASKSQLSYEQQMFFFRRCNSDHIVTAKYFENISMNQMCANSYEITYYTEYPQNRLADVSELQFSEGYSYLIDCLKGFQILSQKVGWFNVTAKMIMFDKDGKLKVWISQNFAQTNVKRSDKLTSEKQFLHRIVALFDSKLSNLENLDMGFRSPRNSQLSYWNLIVKSLIKSNKKLTIKQSLNLLITLAPNHIETARSFLHQSVETHSHSQSGKSQKRTQSKDSRETIAKFSTKNQSNNSSGTQFTNSPVHKFNKDKQRSLKKHKKFSQESHTMQENLNYINTRNTIQMQSPTNARFTANPPNIHNQKIVINQKYDFTFNRQNLQNLSHLQNVESKTSQLQVSRHQSGIQFNKQKHRVFKSHGKREITLKTQENDCKFNNRKSMDEIIYIKKSGDLNITLPFNNYFREKNQPIEVVSNAMENRNTVDINPDCRRFYQLNRTEQANFSQSRKVQYRNSLIPSNTRIVNTGKISKSNFEPFARKFIRKKYEEYPRKELSAQAVSFNINNFEVKNIEYPKQVNFAKKQHNNHTTRHHVRVNLNHLAKSQNPKISLPQQVSNEKTLSQNYSSTQKKRLDQLHTIKSIVYSQANVSEAISLQLLAQNGFSRHLFKGNTTEGQI